MNKHYCIFKTHNHAIAAFGLLKKAGVRCEFVSTPPEYMREKTCSYSIAFIAKYDNVVASILNKNNLDFYIT